jgi:hypothetical protein
MPELELLRLQWLRWLRNGDDVTTDADLNVDGQISMREAFVWLQPSIAEPKATGTMTMEMASETM